MEEIQSPYLTLREAARYLRVSGSTLYKWVHFERIPVLRAGRSLRFERKTLDAWMAERDRPKRKPSLSRFQAVKARWQSRSLTTEHIERSPKSFSERGEG